MPRGDGESWSFDIDFLPPCEGLRLAQWMLPRWSRPWVWCRPARACALRSGYTCGGHTAYYTENINNKSSDVLMLKGNFKTVLPYFFTFRLGGTSLTNLSVA